MHEYTVKHGHVPAPLNYQGFPKSCCTSVNDVICHGIPDAYVLKSGDIVNVDITHDRRWLARRSVGNVSDRRGFRASASRDSMCV